MRDRPWASYGPKRRHMTKTTGMLLLFHSLYICQLRKFRRKGGGVMQHTKQDRTAVFAFIGCILLAGIAEIGDVRRFHSKKALVAYAGIDAPPYQSGQYELKSRSISKRGSSSLRRTLFLVMSVILQNSPEDQPVYQFMDKKRSEGKPTRKKRRRLPTSSFWSECRDSNSRPLEPHSSAIPNFATPGSLAGIIIAHFF